MEEFRVEPGPPDMVTFKKLAEYWTGAIANELYDAPDEVKARFTEFFDLHATILPDSSLNGYHIDLTANIPLEMEGEKPGAYDMVFSPSRRAEHHGKLHVLIIAEIREHKLIRQKLLLA